LSASDPRSISRSRLAQEYHDGGRYCSEFCFWSKTDLPFTSLDNLQLARTLGLAISTGVANGTLVTSFSQDGTPPPLPPGGHGVFFQETRMLTFLPPGDNAVVDTASGASIFGSGGAGESVLAGNGGLSFFATGGSGTVVAGGGNNEVLIPPLDKGSWLVATGAGNDSILALGPGNDTIRPGEGHNLLALGGGTDSLTLTGQDTVSATSGHDRRPRQPEQGQFRRMTLARARGPEFGTAPRNPDERSVSRRTFRSA
jgi:hypothetical protein